jgi:hypothetical protein
MRKKRVKASESTCTYIFVRQKTENRVMTLPKEPFLLLLLLGTSFADNLYRCKPRVLMVAHCYR